jgi:carbamoyltransferase
VVREFCFPNSLGLVYSAITEFLGFRQNDGEGKIMALAAYGKNYLPAFEKIISLTNNGFRVDSSILKMSLAPDGLVRHDALQWLLGRRRKP